MKFKKIMNFTAAFSLINSLAFAAYNDGSGAFATACGGLLFIIIACFIINIMILVWVARDAKARGISSIGWMIFVFFTGLLGLIVYLFARPSGELTICDHCNNKKLSGMAKCPTCGSYDLGYEAPQRPMNAANCAVQQVIVNPSRSQPSQRYAQPTVSTQNTPNTNANLSGPVLLGITGQYANARIPIGQDGIVMGRDQTQCNLVMSSSDISRVHARVSFNATTGKFVIEDLNSTNGVYVGRERVSAKAFLEVGESFTLSEDAATFMVQKTA